MNNKIVLAGNLDFLGLADIFQLLGANGSSGILRIMSQYSPEPGIVYFTKGNPINGSIGNLRGLDAVYSFFGWTRGEFEFRQEPINVARVIKESRMEIILNGLKMLDDGLIKNLGADTVEKKIFWDSHEKGADNTVIRGPLVDYMHVVDEEEFYDGERIVEEGKHGNWIWTILEGRVDIVKESSKGPLTVLKIGDGAFVGSLDSLMTRGSKRSASAIARGNVQLGVLDSQRLSREYTAMSLELKNIMTSLDRRLKRVTNRYVESSIDPNMPEHRFKNVKQLIKQGQAEKNLFRITNGKAFIARQTDHEIMLFSELVQGDYFGNIPFIDMGHEPFSASVFASYDLKTGQVDVEKLQKEYEQLSLTFRNIVANVGTCISATSMIMCNTFVKTER
ncbi:MAG: cyclic nucleotide-binding domain-containing protein [Deltaproteobacteria bacterium]|nr:cyclic nucleotide-binding domain-containing protein [Deltaproteobacteria bacterium]